MSKHLAYHLEELRIALADGDERRVLPRVLDGESTILDVGCGIGQSLVALGTDGRRCIGIDVDVRNASRVRWHRRWRCLSASGIDDVEDGD